jgi:hypothetical protein
VDSRHPRDVRLIHLRQLPFLHGADFEFFILHVVSVFFLFTLIAVALPGCTARIALVAAKILLVATKILLVAMPRRDQWKKNSVGRNKNPVGRDEGRCSGWQFGG